MINGVTINFDHFNDLERLENYAFSIEKCDNMRDLLLLMKMDFEKECDIKEYLFGKSFENLDCPKLTSCFLRSITLSQTFNDDFTFVGRTGEIPCSKLWGDVSRPVKEVLPPCLLAKLHLAMTSSKSYLKYPSKGYAKECASFKKNNLYILFDQIEWNNEDGEVRMCIYVLDGNFLMLVLEKNFTDCQRILFVLRMPSM